MESVNLTGKISNLVISFFKKPVPIDIRTGLTKGLN